MYIAHTFFLYHSFTLSSSHSLCAVFKSFTRSIVHSLFLKYCLPEKLCYGRIRVKLCGKIWHGPRINRLNFSNDQDQCSISNQEWIQTANWRGWGTTSEERSAVSGWICSDNAKLEPHIIIVAKEPKMSYSNEKWFGHFSCPTWRVMTTNNEGSL